jgi:hypothetical protein
MESNASDGKNYYYLKKSGSTIIAIDAPAHGLSVVKSLIFRNMQHILTS